MKKKILAVVTAAVLALGCASAALAYPSYDEAVMDGAFSPNKFGVVTVTTTSGDYKVETSTIDNDLTSTGIIGKKQDVAAGDAAAVKAILFTDLKKTAGVSAGKILAIFTAKYKDLDEDNGSELCFYVDGVKATDSIAMWHWNNKTLQWEQGSKICQVTKVTHNHVYAKVWTLSPVAFVKGGTGATTGTGSTDSKEAAKAATGAKAAPKTGEV